MTMMGFRKKGKKTKSVLGKSSTHKGKASAAMSRYVRLRDALCYCRKHGIDTRQFDKLEDIIGQCCTCGKVKSWILMDAGHWKNRGSGGSSGVYFDERNVHLQCKQCNAFGGGKPKEHEQYIIERYGMAVKNDIEHKHHIPPDMRATNLIATEIMYKNKYDELAKGII